MPKNYYFFSHQKGVIQILIPLALLVFALIIIPFAIIVTANKKSLDTRTKATSNEVEKSFQLIASSDDAYEDADANGNVTVEGSDQKIHMGWGEKAIGLRFRSVDLAELKGAASVSAARLQVKAANTGNQDIKFDVYLEKTDNCKKFEAEPKTITQRTLTNAKMTWDLQNQPWTNTELYKSPSFGSVLSEVINRPAWEGKNLCVILIQKSAESYQERMFWAQEGNVFPPTLIVKYTPAQHPTPSISVTPGPSSTIPTPTEAPDVSPTATPSAGVERSFIIKDRGDDAYEDGDANAMVTIDDTKIRIGWYEPFAALRFSGPGMGMLKNAHIQKAVLKVKSSARANNNVKLSIYAERANDCQAFSTTQKNISGRTLTSKKKTWNINGKPWGNGETYESTNIADVIDEAVSRQNWEGKHLCLIIANDGSDEHQERTFFSKESNQEPAQLIVTYSL